MKFAIIALTLSLTLTGCANKAPVVKAPLESNFGNAEVQFAEFGKTFDEARKKNLSAEEKMKLVLEKAKELEAMDSAPSDE